jgi:hypothetical protein
VGGFGFKGARSAAVAAVGAALAVLAVAGVAGAAATAAGSGRSPAKVKPVIFTDAVGDAEGSAPDIVRVVASNDDAGWVTLEIDLRDPNTINVENTEVLIFIDADRNRYTGNSVGEEMALGAFGGQNPTYDSFYWSGSEWAEVPTSLDVTKSGGGILFFRINAHDLGSGSGSRDFAFEVEGVYTDAAGKNHYDFAPERDLWRYTLHGPDTDGDGLPNEKDACPSVAPSYDPNKNGCPGPYRVMSAKISLAYDSNGRLLTPLGVARLPPGALVTVTCRKGCPFRLRRTVGSDGGVVGFRQFKDRTLGRGGLIEVRATKRGYIGYIALIRGAGPPKGLKIVEKCLPPKGGAPAPCATIPIGS